jgi:hypothetical protein
MLRRVSFIRINVVWTSRLILHEAYLSARVPRTNCGDCGVKTIEVPWARTGSGFTLLFEVLVMVMDKARGYRTVHNLITMIYL